MAVNRVSSGLPPRENRRVALGTAERLIRIAPLLGRITRVGKRHTRAAQGDSNKRMNNSDLWKWLDSLRPIRPRLSHAISP